MAWSTTRPGATRPAPATTKRTGKVLNDDRADWREAWALFPGDIAYVWHGALHADDRRREPGGRRLRHPRADHLGEGAAGARAAATTTGSTSPAGTRCGRPARATGPATASRRRSGRSPAATRTPRPSTARRSRSSACAGRCSTTARPARRSTSRSWAAGTTLIAAETTGRVCLGDRARPGLRRRRGPALAGVHRQGGGARGEAGEGFSDKLAGREPSTASAARTVD